MARPINVLITGGTGFLGTAFLDYVTRSTLGKNTVFYVISSGRTDFTEYQNQSVHYVTHNLMFDTFPDELDEINFDVLIHLATSSTIGPTFDEFTKFDNINTIDNNVLRWATRLNVNRIIWASSGAVYGRGVLGNPFDEKDCLTLADLHTESAYRVGKIQSEFKLQTFCAKYNTEFCIMRLFAFSGSFLPLDVHFALGNFVRDAVNSQNIVINGSGRAVRSYLDQVDFAQIMLEFIFSKDVPCVVNVGSPKGYHLFEVAEIVRKQYQQLFGRDVTIDILNKHDDSASYYVPSVRTLEKYKNLESIVPLEMSINSMIKTYVRTLE